MYTIVPRILTKDVRMLMVCYVIFRIAIYTNDTWVKSLLGVLAANSTIRAVVVITGLGVMTEKKLVDVLY